MSPIKYYTFNTYIMRGFYFFAVFIGYLALSEAAHFKSKHLPSYITACRRADPNAGDCSKNSAIAALPSLLKGDEKYKIPNLLPLKVPKLDLKSGDNLQLTLTDISLYGLDGIVIQKLNVDPVKQRAVIHVKANWLNVDSQYTIKGHILVLPITGSGPANLTFYDSTFIYAMDYDLIKRDDGNEYIKISKLSTDIDIPRAFFNLENLFNGNTQLGDYMNNFLNENSQEVIKDLGVPVLAEVIQGLVTLMFDNIARSVPYDELLPL